MVTISGGSGRKGGVVFVSGRLPHLDTTEAAAHYPRPEYRNIVDRLR